MPWIDDVVPYSTILSTWGNKVRSQLVQIFDSNEWNTAPVQQEGMLGFNRSNNQFVYRDEAGWHYLVDSLPKIPDWRAGYGVAKFSYWDTNGIYSENIPFTSPMTAAGVVMYNTPGALYFTRMWVSAVTTSSFAMTAPPSETYLQNAQVGLYYLAIVSR